MILPLQVSEIRQSTTHGHGGTSLELLCRAYLAAPLHSYDIHQWNVFVETDAKARIEPMARIHMSGPLAVDSSGHRLKISSGSSEISVEVDEANLPDLIISLVNIYNHKHPERMPIKVAR